jgi:hypothetical protein
VHNAGPDAVGVFQVGALLPPGVEAVGVPVCGEVACVASASANAVSAQWRDLAAGASATLTLNVIATSRAERLSAVALLSLANPALDADPARHRATATSRLRAPAYARRAAAVAAQGVDASAR